MLLLLHELCLVHFRLKQIKQFVFPLKLSENLEAKFCDNPLLIGTHVKTKLRILIDK